MPGYDAWKLHEPDYDDEPEECCHEDYEVDIHVGRATCNMCGHSWWQSPEEIEAECRRIAEYAEWQRKQDRREFWRRVTYPIRWPIHRMLDRLWPRKSLCVLTDDEIPF